MKAVLLKLGGFVSLLFGRPRAYSIDWRAGTSDFPPHKGSPPFGTARNRVAVDGQNVDHLYIVRIRTGQRGYIDFQVYGRKDEPLAKLAPNGRDYAEGLTARIEGRVEYLYLPDESGAMS
jgi:hypothetical protein